MSVWKLHEYLYSTYVAALLYIVVVSTHMLDSVAVCINNTHTLIFTIPVGIFLAVSILPVKIDRRVSG